MPALLKFERHRQLLRRIQRAGQISVTELSAAFSVSEATIRRDLELLAREGLIHRQHGGAVSLTPVAPEAPILQRSAEHAPEKRRIAHAAAALVKEGETLFIGSGSTTLEVAREIADFKNLTVITNALTVATLLAGRAGISLIVVGGFLRVSEMSLIGHLAEEGLKDLRADKLFMGVRAVSTQAGLTNDYLPEIMTDRAIMAIASQRILVADSSKFETVAPSRIAPITAMQTIVTDAGLPTPVADNIRELGIELILA